MISQPTIGSIVHGFFEDYLKLEKGLRPNSIKSYRDALRLFLQFSAQEARCNLTRLSLDDLSAERVTRFLDSLEVTRENQIRSRNLRLTALRVFFEYLGRQLPERLLQAQRVVSISTKRTPPPTTSYLEREEMEALFAGMPHTGRFALRDRALLLFLFNTGARVQEVADLRVANLDFVIGPRVRLHGKGDKWRLCPLWDETCRAIDATAGGIGPTRRSHRTGVQRPRAAVDAFWYLQNRPSPYWASDPETPPTLDDGSLRMCFDIPRPRRFWNRALTSMWFGGGSVIAALRRPIVTQRSTSVPKPKRSNSANLRSMHPKNFQNKNRGTMTPRC